MGFAVSLLPSWVIGYTGSIILFVIVIWCATSIMEKIFLFCKGIMYVIKKVFYIISFGYICSTDT